MMALLFDEDELRPCSDEWQNMPEFDNQDLSPRYQVLVSFSCAGDVEDFGKLIGHSLKAKESRQLPSVWYPEQEIGRMSNKRFIDKGAK